MACRKPINDEHKLLKVNLRSVSIDLQSDVECLERRFRRLLWDLQEISIAIEQVERSRVSEKGDLLGLLKQEDIWYVNEAGRYFVPLIKKGDSLFLYGFH